MKSPFLIVCVSVALFTTDHAQCQAPVRTPELVRAYVAFGDDIGVAGIVPSTVPGSAELFLDGDHDGPYLGNRTGSFWHTLRFDASIGGYVQLHSSEIYAQEIRQMVTVDLHASPGEELLVAFENGDLHLYHQSSKALLSVILTGVSNLKHMALANLDGVGGLELILLNDQGLHVFDSLGNSLAQYPNMLGFQVAVGQLDSDPSLEIAVSDGLVLDYATGQVQCTWPVQFGRKLVLNDFDGDGMEELIYAEASGFVRAYDIDSCTMKWELAVGNVESIAVGDSDADGLDEILVAVSSSGETLQSFDINTLALNWSFSNQEGGGTSILLSDTDQDGFKEVLWGTGRNSSGDGYLFVMDPVAQVVEWKSYDLRGPFAGPVLGDVDGDGVDEIVSLSRKSQSGYGAGRIIVMEQDSSRVYVSQETLQENGAQGAWDVKLFDFNGDGDMEILIGGSVGYSALMEIYDFSPSGTFTLAWENNRLPNGGKFRSVDAADLDGDGSLEIIGGIGNSTSSSSGTSVFVYDLLTGNKEWQSLHMGGYWDDITSLTHGDFDGDGEIEIAALLEGESVYILGPDGSLEAVIVGHFISLLAGPIVSGQLQRLVLGTETGEIEVYHWGGLMYELGISKGILSAPVDGFSLPLASSATHFVGSEGYLKMFKRTTRSVLWQSEWYGDLLGRTISQLSNGDILVSSNAGLYFFGVR